MKKTFLDVMIYEAMGNGDEVRFLALHDQGGRYINVDEEYEIVVERVPDFEETLKKEYPEDLFYAYFSNEFEEHERELSVFCMVEEENFRVNFDLENLKDGELSVTCFWDIPLHLEEMLEESLWECLKRTYPQFETILLNYLREYPAYRLYFITNTVEIVE